ncbi:MAG: hypothetical protein AAGN66_11725 [Acidobacteriota bacterium]
MFRRANLTTHDASAPMPRAAFLGIAVALVSFLVAGVALADDRELLRDSTGDPYVFIIFDTSGSMNWTPACTEEDAAIDIDPWDGKCTFECPLDDAQCANVCPNFGCVEYAETAAASTPIVEVLDQDNPSDATVTGSWTEYSSPGEAINDTYLVASAGADASVTFARTLPSDGEYHVYIQWPSRSHRAENTLVEITHAGGLNTLEVDQSDGRRSGEFSYLGTFDFTTAAAAQVRISANTATGTVAADAVRFSRLPPPASPTCVDTGWRCEQPLCPQGDCNAPMGADDPTSKFFQARWALDEVLSEVDEVNFGFASFEQDNVRLTFKHFLYDVPSLDFNGNVQNQLDIDGIKFPQYGAKEVLGTGAPFRQNDGQSEDPFSADGSAGFYHCAVAGIADDDNSVGCVAAQPADLRDLWEIQRVHRIPKLGRTEAIQTYVWLRGLTERDPGVEPIYRVDYEPHDSTTYSYGDEWFPIELDLHYCPDGDCDAGEKLVDDMVVWLEFVGDYGEWQGRASRTPMQGAGFFQFQTTQLAGSTCNGLEENDDWDNNLALYTPFTSHSDDDAWWGYPIKWAWEQDPRGEKHPNGDPLPFRIQLFDSGDFIPLDWEDSNNEHVRRRLAPNAWEINAGTGEIQSTGEVPDFRTAPYFADVHDEFETDFRRRLKLRDGEERPLLAYGSTPLGNSLQDFAKWYAGDTDRYGWKDYASIFDLDWACKEKFVLLLTDGDETCTSVADACTQADNLLDRNQVKTFVVGFGLPDAGDALTCMAENGGTGEPILPRNKDELVEALEAVLQQIRTESRAFASASIPAVQSTAADKIYLSSFTPIPGVSVWPGRLDVFRQPLPLTDDRRPDISKQCRDAAGVRQSACHLFDLGDTILDQAPTEIEVEDDPPVFKIGNRDDERRVFYGQGNPDRARPSPLRLFQPPEGLYAGQAEDLQDLIGFPDTTIDPFTDSVTGTGLFTEDEIGQLLAGNITDAAVTNMVRERIGETLHIKEKVIFNADGTEVGCTGDPTQVPCRYVMGDIFHANPVVLASPDNFDLFTQDLCGTPPPRGQPNNCVPTDQFNNAAEMEVRGYREYVRRNVWRRRMLAAATNDGQLHFFDAGTYVNIDDPNLGEVEVFTDGTGAELFSYIPRWALPVVRDQALGNQHVYSVDGSMAVGDVFMDPVFEVEPDENQREWRSVVVGGLREGGDVFDQVADTRGFVGGYFALDLTQPDILETADRDSAFEPYTPASNSLIPTCLDADYAGSGDQVAVNDCRTLSGEDVPFPMELWTFTDSVNIDGVEYFLNEERYLKDEDLDGIHDGGIVDAGTLFSGNLLVRDLGQTWSQPVIGQIPVCGGPACDFSDPLNGSADDVTTKWVAIFGGGMDPGNKNNPTKGTWIYMVDIETGNALYKRQVQGAVPSDPAVLDIDQDGILDRIYIGTTEGLLYKIDLKSKVPTIVDHQIHPASIMGWEPDSDGDGVIDDVYHTVQRIKDVEWDPYPILFTNSPIYYPPSMFRIPEREQYGGALGVGDREDLWDAAGQPGRFFVFVDEDFPWVGFTDPDDPSYERPELPIFENELQVIDWQSDQFDSDADFLLAPGPDATRPGWAMTFPPEYRATNPPFVLAGLLIFSVFEPLNFTVEDLGGGGGPGGADPQVVCARTGTTYSFVTFLNNANGLADLGNCGGGRCEAIDDFTTAVHTDRTVSKNPPPEEGSQTLGQDTGSIIDDALANAIREAILGQMPRSCQINEKYEILVSALRNSTGINVYAKVPMVVCPGDWKN